VSERPSPEELRRLYWEEGMLLEQIGQIYGRSPGQVRNWMVNDGIPRRPTGGPTENSNPPIPIPEGAEGTIRQMYLDERLMILTIADHFGVSNATIYNWMGHFGIPLRPGGSREEVYPGIWRKVVGKVEVPYDTNFRGETLTVPMWELECGHRIRLPVKKKGQGSDYSTPPVPKEKRCLRCEREKENQ
jgi:hypothetical protein